MQPLPMASSPGVRTPPPEDCRVTPHCHVAHSGSTHSGRKQSCWMTPPSACPAIASIDVVAGVGRRVYVNQYRSIQKATPRPRHSQKAVGRLYLHSLQYIRLHLSSRSNDRIRSKSPLVCTSTAFTIPLDPRPPYESNTKVQKFDGFDTRRCKWGSLQRAKKDTVPKVAGTNPVLLL